MFKNSLLAELEAEHRILLVKLNQLEEKISTCSTSSLENLVDLEEQLKLLKTFVVDIHHRKEEDILFPLIQKMIPLRQGGPRCTFFMNLKLTHDVGGWIFQEARNKNIPTALPSKYNFYMEAQSPLLIPLEEHWAGELALQIALEEIACLKENKNSSFEPLESLLRKYIELLRLHSRKEDECLFVLSDNFLNYKIGV